MGEQTISIRDRVDVKAHPTVVRLDDLDSADAKWIAESFLLTPEVGNHLKVLRQLFKKGEGCGIFLIGHYGCGKSHFLAYLIQQLRGQSFVSPCPSVYSISLVNFSADNRLEDIVAQVLNIHVQKADRRKTWNTLFEGQHPNGFVLVLDELSEFLRSKPDVRTFTEDIRFLQFVGEWTQQRRFWIVAAMQEAIEHTGELEHSLYRKIKDRYPLRLLLTPAHVQTLIADSILTKKTGYQDAVDTLAAEMTCAFPHAQLDESQLRTIYPLHPATLELLEEVRDRFSQARGVVDFAVSRLLGDPKRGIEPFLDQPWGSFLTPDTIVDHFHDLFELQPEFTALAQQVLPWYQKHLDGLFEKQMLHRLAERLLKLLILTYISPARESLSSEQAAAWLLFSTIRTDPTKNQAIVQKVLTRLVEQGRYVTGQGGRFRLNLKDDGRALLEKILVREVEALKGNDILILEILTPLLPADGVNPFRLPRNQWQHRRVLWHFHERHFAVWFGEDRPSKFDDLALCIRPPWGTNEHAPGLYIIEPAQIVMTDDMIELAALVRIGEKPNSPEVAKIIGQRLESRLPTFQKLIQSAWSEATLTTPEGRQERPPRPEKENSLGSWLETLALWMLRRRFPAFERFAPAHSSLPKEAWLRFMRFANQDDLGQSEADDYVKLIREAYLVPMGLMRRNGRDYALPTNLEKQELVKLVMPLLEHNPSPKTIHQHLADPIYGLVPDQINLLLVFLLLQGEIDILKDRQSYREAFETLPNPLQYDRVVLGHALTSKQLDAMQQLCGGLKITVPKQWTVLAQRRIVEKIRETGRRYVERLQSLFAELQSSEQGKPLLEPLNNHIQHWSNLDKGDNALQGFEHFLYGIGSIGGFLDEIQNFNELPDRLPRLLAELQRLQHLLDHPAIKGNTATPIKEELQALDTIPNLDQADELDQWLMRARNLYEGYKTEYELNHQRWWQTQNNHPIWKWRPPLICSSQHLGLADTLTKLESCHKEAEQQKCRGLVNLDYQPLCTCGFDGNASPIIKTLERYEALQGEIENQLRLFFQQDTVKTQIRDWKQQGFELTAGTNAYLAGSRQVPEITDITLFDQHLSGVKLAQDVAITFLDEIFTKRVWETGDLQKAMEQELSRYKGKRLHFVDRSRHQELSNEMADWCAEQCLRSSKPLPAGLDRTSLAKISTALRPQYVSDATILNLEKLGFDNTGQDRILEWLMDGHIPLVNPRPQPETVVFAVHELLHPQTPSTPEELANLCESLYRHHVSLNRLAGKNWLDHLESVSRTKLPPLPSLSDRLKEHPSAQWLLIDCLGLPLLDPLNKVIASSLYDWNLADLQFACVSDNTTTDGCYRELLHSKINHPFEKCNTIDELIHRSTLPFNDLVTLAETELEIALKAFLPKLDPNKDLIIFSDHGFRLSKDGHRYEHGTGSILERIVPVWHFN